MGNGFWSGKSSREASDHRWLSVGAIGALLILLVTASVLLGLSYRLHNQNSAQTLTSPSRTFSQSSLQSSSLRPVYSKQDAQAVLGKLPLIFEPNQGQSDPGIKFLAHGAGYGLFLDATGAVLALQTTPVSRKGAGEQVIRMRLAGANARARIAGDGLLPGKSNYFIGNDRRRWRSGVPQFAGVRYENVYPGTDLVFYGNQGHLEYDFRVAPGADPSRAVLQFDRATKLALSGGDLLVTRKDNGDNDGKAVLRLKAPQIYQRNGEAREGIDGGFVLRADNRVSFEIGSYDRRRELVIDPALDFSSYFGAIDAGAITSVAVNGDGFIYLAGSTTAASAPGSFPLNGTTPTTLGTAANIFVAKINPSSPPAVVYATFFGGNGTDTIVGLGVDLGGNTYVAGNTTSTGTSFPTTSLAYQTSPMAKGSRCSGVTCTSLFVSELASGGAALNYSSYVSGNGDDVATGMTIDTNQDVFVTGTTTSDNTPSTTVAFPATLLPVPFQSASLASIQFFATEVSTRVPGVGSIAYSTYFGGNTPVSPIAIGGGIAVDTTGNMYFSGTTNFYNSGSGLYGNSGTSGDFPILDSYQPCLDTIPPLILSNPNACTAPTTTPYPTDAFVAKINPLAQAGAQLLYSTYFGGTSTDYGNAITVDSGAANVYLTGKTNSSDFFLPTGTQAFQSCLNDPGVVEVSTASCPTTTVPATNYDAYVARFTNPSTSTTGTPNFLALSYFSYLGGGGNDAGLAIAVDTASDALVTGTTNSGTNATAGINNPPNLPTTTGAIQTVLNGAQNAFFAHISTTTVPSQTQIGNYVTYFGGSGTDAGTSIAVDPNLNTYFAGNTTSPNLQTDDPLLGAGGTTLSGTTDAFVVKLGTESDLCITCVAPFVSPTGVVSAGNQVTVTFNVFNAGPDVASQVNVTGLVPTGVVFDSASVGSGTCSTPTGTTVVCQIPTLQAGATSIVTFVVTPTIAGTFQAMATVSSANNTNTNNTVTASFTASGYTVAISPSSQTVPAGETAQYSVVVAPTQGVFGANVSLTCSALPTGATCNFTTSTLNLSNGAGSASSILNLLTTAQPVSTASAPWHGPLYALWLTVPGMAFLGLGAGGRKRRRTWLLGLLALAAFFTLTLMQPACSRGVTQPTVSGTPSGTYSLTVTATSGSFTRTANFSLVVIP
jgi:Domain of unknown function DUF11/Beta-propeller repeat